MTVHSVHLLRQTPQHTTSLSQHHQQVFPALCSSISISLAFLADVLSPQCRAAAFGGLMAAFSLGIIVGPLVGGLLVYSLPNGALVVTWGALGTCVACVVYVLVCIPETLPSGVARKVCMGGGEVLLCEVGCWWWVYPGHEMCVGHPSIVTVQP